MPLPLGVATSNLASRVTTAEGTVTSQGQLITSLQADLSDAASGVQANADATSNLASRVTTAEGTVTSQGQLITSLQADLTDAASGVQANADATSNLVSRVTTSEGTVTSQGQLITSLQADLTDAASGVQANADAAAALTSRVTAAEGTVTSQGQSITSLQADLTNATTGVQANADATTNLTSRVTATEGAVTSYAASVTSLTSTVGDHTASIATQSQTLDGISAEYTFLLNNNGHISGLVQRSELNDENAPVSSATFIADKFAIVAPGGGAAFVPFTVFTTPQTISGVIYPAGVYTPNIIIGEATIDTLHVKNGAMSSSDIADLTVPLTLGAPFAAWRGVVQLALPTDGGNRLAIFTDVDFGAGLSGNPSGDPQGVQWRMLLDGDVIWERGLGRNVKRLHQAVSNAGHSIMILQVAGELLTQVTVHDATIYAIENKK